MSRLRGLSPMHSSNPSVRTPAPGNAGAGEAALDRLGIGLSGLCAVHCLLTPLLLATLPLWPAAGALHAWLHPLFALLIVPVTVLAIRSGYRRHGAAQPLLLLGAGLALIVAALAGHDAWGAGGEILLTLLGSGLLLAGHHHNRCSCSAPGRP